MNAPVVRHCPVPACGGTARAGHLMCRRCWSAVPADIQRNVHRAWRSYRRAIAAQAALSIERRLAFRRDYLEATNAAIAAVERSRP